MKFGYARTSTQEAQTGQTIDSQIHMLNERGCERIFADEARTGTKDDNREQLTLALEMLREGDELLFADFSRVSRTKYGPFIFLAKLDERGIYWKSVEDEVDSNSPHALIVTAIRSMENTEFIHKLRTKTKAGIAAARARGVHIGRPRALTKSQEKLIRSAYFGEQNTVRELTEMFGTSKSTIYRLLGSSMEVK